METFSNYTRIMQNMDFRINPRTRDLNCLPGYERTEAEVDEARQQVLEDCIDQAGSWAIMFNETQFKV